MKITTENNGANDNEEDKSKINIEMSNGLSELGPKSPNSRDADHKKHMSYFDEYLQNLNQDRYNNEHGNDPIGDRSIENDPISIGIITLEDVIEHALQTELVDEHDVFVDHKHTQKTNRLSRIDWSVLQLFDHRQKMMTSLPPQELQAVYHFLGQSIKVFMPKYRKCSESSIKNLLSSSNVVKVDIQDINQSTSLSRGSKRNQRDPYKDIENNGLLLYQRDKKTEYFTLILDGKCEIYAGRQGFRSTLSRWSYLCPDALDHVEQCITTGRPLLDYVPDFTCKVVENARLLRIRLSDFKACIQGQFDGLRNDLQFGSLGRGFSEPAILPNHQTLSQINAKAGSVNSDSETEELMKERKSSNNVISPAAKKYIYTKSRNDK